VELNVKLNDLRMERKVAILRSKKVVGLTITGTGVMGWLSGPLSEPLNEPDLVRKRNVT
jgi:hypothetical protein